MSELDLAIKNSPFFTRSESQDASHKLSDQATNLAAAALTATALVIVTKGRALPELAKAGETELGEVLRSAKGLTREFFGLGSDTLGAGSRSASDLVAKDFRAAAKTAYLDTDNPSLAANALSGEAKVPSKYMELGARPAPQYGKGARPMEEKHLDFIEKWPVEGVRVHPDGVDVYVTKNGHWLELKNFSPPAENVHALDILNTRVSQVRVSQTMTGSSEKPTTQLLLQLGRRDPVKLTGKIKVTEFWH